MISAVVLTKNEEKNITKCLHSLEWCDEIVIIDDYSTDKTVEEVEKLNKKNIKIYKRHLHGDFAAQRNFGLEKARSEWVLFIDADEIISSSLQYEIVSVINSSIENMSGYYIRRVDTMWGRVLKYGETGNIKILRLARKMSGKWSGAVHEVWNVSGKTGELKNPIKHYPHQTISEFLQEVNDYTTIRADELFKRRVKVYWWSIVVYPFSKFIINYLLKAGFMDGIPGIVVALIMSLHSFLVRGKLWWLWQKNR